MRRPSGTALFLGGLGLLSTGGVLVGTLLSSDEEVRSRGTDPVSEEESAHGLPAVAAAIPTQRVPRGPSAPSPRPGPRPRAGPERRATRPTPLPRTGAGGARVGRDRDEAAYVVEGETLRRAVAEVDEALSTAMPELGAALSGLPKVGLRVSSDAGTATLDAQGLTVTDLDLRQGLGLQVGDTIVSLNGHRVDGLGAWWVLQDLANDRTLTELRLEIYRRGERLYKTYPVVWQ